MAIAILQGGAVDLRVLVEFTLPSGNYRAVSGDNALQFSPIVSGLSGIGAEMDVITRRVSFGEVSITLLDDFELRSFIEADPFFGRGVDISLGTRTAAFGAYKRIFSGIVQEMKPSEGKIEIIVQDIRAMLRDRQLLGSQFTDCDSGCVVARHPLQIIKAILDVILPASKIDAPSFDPDVYDTGPRAMSHWNTARAKHGDFDRRIEEPENAMQMIEDLALLMDGGLIIDLDGKLSFKAFDPTTATVADFTDDDIQDFRQLDTFDNLFNKFTVNFAWSGKAGGDAIINYQKRSYRVVNPDLEYLRSISRSDPTSISDYAFPGEGGRSREHTISTKWLGVDAVINNDLGRFDTSVEVIAGHTGSFTGVERFLGGVSDGKTKFTLNGGDRVAFFRIRSKDNFGTVVAETVKATAVTSTFIPESSPTRTGDNDLIGVTRATFTIERAQLGSIARPFSRYDLISDITIPLAAAERRIPRFKDGLPLLEMTAGIENADIEVADFVSLVNSTFLARGFDGLTSSDKLEVTSVLIEALTDNPRVTFKVVPVLDPSVGLDDESRDKLPFPTEPKDYSKVFQKVVQNGLTVSAASGLAVAITPGIAMGTNGLIRTGSIPDVSLIASKDTYLTIDSHTDIINKQSVDVGDPAPDLAIDQVPLARITTDGSGVTAIQDIRVREPVLSFLVDDQGDLILDDNTVFVTPG